MTTTEHLPRTTLPAPRPLLRRALAVLTVLLLIAAAVLAVIGWKAGLFASAEAMQGFLAGMGLWAPAIFLAVHVVQIVLPVIPGAVACSVGVLAFGPVWGFVYNYAGIVLGSCLAFALARRYGHGLIRALAPPRAYERYAAWLDRAQQRFERLFAAAIFLPCAPDDLLCMLAGVSRMSFRRFLLILLLCKPLFLLPYSFGITGIRALLAAIA